MKRQVELNYDINDAWLAPWLDGLWRGKAVASTCSGCNDVRFPPLRTCPSCRLPSDGWRALAGGATILFRATGLDGDFAMVRFDGTSGCAIADTSTLSENITRVVIVASPEDSPTLSLAAEPMT